MGITHSLFGSARKRVGSVVLAKGQNGKTIVRNYQSQVKNPKSDAQCLQRAIFNTCITAYSQLKNIVDHSFEGIAYGSQSQQYFMKRNLQLIRSMVAAGSPTNLNIKGNPFITLNPFVISKGSLPYVPVVNIDRTDKYISFGSEVTDAESWTIGKLRAATGMELGDQITFIALDEQTTGSYVGFDSVKQYRTGVHYARIIINATATDDMNISENNSWNSAAVSVETSPFDSIELNNDNNYMAVVFKNVTPSMAAVILSRKSGNTWLRSFAQLTPMGTGVNPLLISPSYGKSASIEFSSDYYLNQAQSGNGSINIDTTGSAASVSSLSLGDSIQVTNGGTAEVGVSAITPEVVGSNLQGKVVRITTQEANGSETTLSEGEASAQLLYTSNKTFTGTNGTTYTFRVYVADTLMLTATVSASSTAGQP